MTFAHRRQKHTVKRGWTRHTTRKPHLYRHHAASCRCALIPFFGKKKEHIPCLSDLPSHSVSLGLGVGRFRVDSVRWASSSCSSFSSVYPKHTKPGQRHRGARVYRFQLRRLTWEGLGRCVFIPVCMCRCNEHICATHTYRCVKYPTRGTSIPRQNKKVWT